ncbi:hypothetical protein Y71_14815 [Kosakonia radicincitans DSM 16656]|uniref:hypothetical protein n=1 Tax=Kosakonia TaxID=1330547 RepID=UPI0005646340|nr:MULTISPECIES: hypothetical protein [Kosakonia]ARD61127.1 hypothetical protein Y71_14815 [Kosakonia radicincitans DSM 16656]NCF03821.1 hypothetical protein [Kosakonia sp. MH5]
MLTFQEVAAINYKLRLISDTWSDLWLFLYYIPVSVGRIVELQYSDIIGNYLIIKQKRRLKEKSIHIPTAVLNIINRRKQAYPDDTFIFQSHSNRVKYKERPVTVIAFNQALKRASIGVTEKIVTSRSVQSNAPHHTYARA